MPISHQAYRAFERAKRGEYPNAKYRPGKRIRDWIRAVDSSFPDEKLSAALQRDKRNVLFPTIAFLSLHPGYVDGDDGPHLSDDFRWMQGVYDRLVKRLEGAVNGQANTKDLYERSTRALRNK